MPCMCVHVATDTMYVFIFMYVGLDPNMQSIKHNTSITGKILYETCVLCTLHFALGH